MLQMKRPFYPFNPSHARHTCYVGVFMMIFLGLSKAINADAKIILGPAHDFIHANLTEYCNDIVG
jgi:CO dehydrogenase/acetyl-CoA synthase delta subunit